MNEIENDEQLLDQFRRWLQETRQEAAGVDGSANNVTHPPHRFGLDRLVEEFTALRHELKLQTRSSRALEERVETSLTTLADASSTFRLAAAQDVSARTESAEKKYAITLAELDEALARGREQWEMIGERLTGPTSPDSLTQLNKLYAGQSLWQRWLTAVYHHRICRQLAQAEEQYRNERKKLLTALLSGYDMIHQRLTRTMANAGVLRIATVGRIVDPEQMVVMEVVDATGQSGQVIAEIRRGYTWKGVLLRPAEVRAIRPRLEESAPAHQSSLQAEEVKD